jgi:hypothetical protein
MLIGSDAPVKKEISLGGLQRLSESSWRAFHPTVKRSALRLDVVMTPARS